MTACGPGTCDFVVTVIIAMAVWHHRVTWLYGSGTSLPGCALWLALHMPIG
jgi:hypothetical protein